LLIYKSWLLLHDYWRATPHTLQLRLREIFQEILEDSFGPQQIFISSHSPAFEFGKHFYAMRMGNEGPFVEHRPIKQATDFN